MDRARQRELLPHYVAIVLLIAGVLGGIRLTLGEVGVVPNLVSVVVVVLVYPSIVRQLGVAPSSWEQ